jgi:hypothetical protein
MEEYVLLNNNSHVTFRAFNDPNGKILNLSTLPAPKKKNE